MRAYRNRRARIPIGTKRRGARMSDMLHDWLEPRVAKCPARTPVQVLQPYTAPLQVDATQTTVARWPRRGGSRWRMDPTTYSGGRRSAGGYFSGMASILSGGVPPHMGCQPTLQQTHGTQRPDGRQWLLLCKVQRAKESRFRRAATARPGRRGRSSQRGRTRPHCRSPRPRQSPGGPGGSGR